MKEFYQDSWLKFNKASIKVLVGTLILLICLSVTFAWFTDSDNFSNESDTGNIYVSLVSHLSEIEMIAPNETINFQNMVYVEGKPTSADAYVRISYKAYVGDDDVTNYIRPILYNNAEYLLNGHDAWIYNNTDGKYYYVGYTNENVPAVFCNGIYVDQTLPKAFANKTVIFTVTVDAIQRKYKAYETEPGWQENYPADWASYLEKYGFEINPDDE